MRPTPSNYVQDLERNGKTVTVIRGFEGADYLNMWADTREAYFDQKFPKKSNKSKSKKSKKSTEQPADK
jgi:large subunit ribosomal protein L41